MHKHSYFDNYIMNVNSIYISHHFNDSHSSNCACSVQACKTERLVTGIAFQPLKGTDALISGISDNEDCTCKVQ